jgi:hypothetical protein
MPVDEVGAVRPIRPRITSPLVENPVKRELMLVPERATG